MNKKILKENYFLYAILIILFFLLGSSQIIRKNNIFLKFDITLVGTNDIHGTAYPTLLSRKDSGQRYTYGGLTYMAKIIQILRQQNNGNFLYLDAGDQFQGGLQASKLISSGQIISDYFNHLNLQAGAVGNHQFDFGPSFLDSYLSKLQNDILSANLIDKRTNQMPLKNQQKSKIYTFPLKQRSPLINDNLTDIKIGVIGLSTIQTPFKTSGFIDGLFPDSYQFQNYLNVVIQQAQKLKQKGTHAIILVTHVGNQCNDDSTYGIWSLRNQKMNPCHKNDQIFQLIDNLPSGLINVVVQGHRHTQSHYFYKNIPIIGTINGGYYLNAVRLRFSLYGSKAFLDPQDILIEGPIPVCAKIFQNTHKCQYVSPNDLKNAGNLIQWKFHGKNVVADPELTLIYKQKYAQKMKKYEYQIANNYIPYPLIKDYGLNSSLGNLVTNLLANGMKQDSSIKFDFVILNGGGFRTTWYPGIIRYAQLHSMFPFDNDLMTFKVLGSDLKQILQILQNGQKKFYPTWGLSQTFVKTTQKLVLKSLKLANGQQIIDNKIYKGLTIGFLLNGGDDFNTVISKGINVFEKVTYPVLMKEFMQTQLEKMKDITQDALKNPTNLERIIIENEQLIIFN